MYHHTFNLNLRGLVVLCDIHKAANSPVQTAVVLSHFRAVFFFFFSCLQFAVIPPSAVLKPEPETYEINIGEATKVFLFLRGPPSVCPPQ